MDNPTPIRASMPYAYALTYRSTTSIPNN
ncbi:protein of unknown function [Paraburkholderia dioscoreae]|uniref:Uncharacterized protein n=1 Tax=Paraburkholderia dioscoreae TaxID=2604047 RepID=A0A5Q4ZE39_9BURK|nr:protein of unknown function [Paraburkholderia dioscoreae]